MSQNQAAELFTCAAPRGFDAARLRRDFPALDQQINGKPLVYLDSAASAQKPLQMLEAMERFYRSDYANIHRGVHELSGRATAQYEAARASVRRFINAADEHEIVFTRNATEAVNLVAASWGRRNLKAGDEVLVTALEHHANIVPWQMLEAELGIKLVAVPISDAGEVTIEAVRACLTLHTKLVSVAHVSNALGTILPVAEIIALAHGRNIPVLIDGCQAVCHMPVDVRGLGADFYVFSGHKLYGPTGIGVLYGRAEVLADMPPYQGGGDMIETVSFKGTVFKEPPFRFEAGTPAIAEAIGLAAAIDYVSAIGMSRIAAHEQDLLAYATERLKGIDGLRLVGTAKEKASAISFVIEGAHPGDIGTLLDKYGVAVRTGHHCAQPVMERLGLPGGTVRASFGLYNTHEDIDRFVAALKEVREMLR
ncbi:MAG: cysteine desulfurase [Alphaproteobacteria bacterium]